MSARFLPLPLRRGPSELLSGLPAQGTTRVVVATWQLYCSSIVDCLMYWMESLHSASISKTVMACNKKD